MAAPSQQRTSRARTVLRRSVPPRVPDILWTPAWVNATHLSINMDVNPVGLSLTGIPQVQLEPASQLPIGAVIVGQSLVLEYPSDISLETQINYPSLDPALRGQKGEFVSGANYIRPAPTVLLDWIVQRGVTTTTLHLTPIGGIASWCVDGDGDFVTDNSLYSVSWAYNGSYFVIEMSGDVIDAVTLQKAGSTDDVINVEGKRLLLATNTIT